MPSLCLELILISFPDCNNLCPYNSLKWNIPSYLKKKLDFPFPLAILPKAISLCLSENRKMLIPVETSRIQSHDDILCLLSIQANFFSFQPLLTWYIELRDFTMMIWLIHLEKFISSLALNSANAHNFPMTYKNTRILQVHSLACCFLLFLIYFHCFK